MSTDVYLYRVCKEKSNGRLRIESPVETWQVQHLGWEGCVLARDGVEINFEVLLENMKGYCENDESESAVVETLQKLILRNGVRHLLIL